MGGAAKGTAAKKIQKVLSSGELSENLFLPLAFESEGAKAEEVGKLLHAWAKLYKELRDASNGEIDESPALQVEHRAPRAGRAIGSAVQRYVAQRYALSKSYAGRRLVVHL